MRALIWKELRENFRWALLAALALGGAEIYALYRGVDGAGVHSYSVEGITLCSGPFLSVTLFGGAVAGLGLGLLQVLPELRRDRWAALLHRPLSRGGIFAGKAIAGGMLYLGATGLPLLLSILLVATPGHFPTPFAPAMIHPGVADLLGGLGYYFAGLLMALEGGSRARRALPLLAAAGVTSFCLEAQFFRTAAVASLAMAAVLALAGWGAIHGREALARRPWLGRVAFLVVAIAGACAPGELARAVGDLASRVGPISYSEWVFFAEGPPARQDYVDHLVVALRDVDGRFLLKGQDRAKAARSVSTSNIGEPHPRRSRERESGYRETWVYLHPLRRYPGPEFEQWFHMARERIFVCVRPRERRVVGSFGANGFTPPGTRAQSFSEEVSLIQLEGAVIAVASPDALGLADLERREVETLTLPAAGPLLRSGECWTSVENQGVSFVAVGLRDRMAVYDARGQLRATLPYRRDVERWGQLSLGIAPSMTRFLLYYGPSPWLDRRIQQQMPSFLDVTDARGEVVTSYTLPPLPPEVVPPHWTDYVADWLRPPGFFFGEMLYRRIGAAFGSKRLAQALETQLGEESDETRRQAWHLLPAALLLPALTLAWARRAQWSRRRAAGWSLAVLFLGPPGFVVFWLAGERPSTLPCPACGRRRRLDRERCAHCGAAWPTPRRDGTEILDNPLPAAPTAAGTELHAL